MHIVSARFASEKQNQYDIDIYKDTYCKELAYIIIRAD